MRTVTYLMLLAAIASAQSQEKVEFEVASVKPSPPRGPGFSGCKGGPGSDDPTRIICEDVTLQSLVMRAFGLKYFQIVEPDWMAYSKFDVVTTAAKGTTKEQVSLMWQNLLADRLGFRAHHEDKETKYLEITVAKNGPKLKPPQPNAAQRMGSVGRRLDGTHLFFPKATMALLTSVLENQSRMPAKDATGLSGEYEIALVWLPDDNTNATIDSPPPLAQALREQLGLQLTTKTGPMDTLVIDHIERTPTGN